MIHYSPRILEGEGRNINGICGSYSLPHTLRSVFAWITRAGGEFLLLSVNIQSSLPNWNAPLPAQSFKGA